MAGGSAGSDVQTQLRAAFALGGAGGLSDGQLLRRFLGSTDEAARAAFDALVARHGPMVLRACRRATGDPHDAQDAFQATFLILARKAGSIRDGESLAGWLHGVAIRVAGRGRVDAARRRLIERRAAASRALDARPEDFAAEPWDGLHEEIERLPGRYREPVVLCYLEGLTAEAAAARIGCPRGTVLSRLSRARERLRAGLARRGLAPPAALSAWIGTPGPALPPAIIAATTHAALGDSGRCATEVAFASASATALAKGTLKTMMISKLKLIGAIAATGLLSLGGVRALALPSGIEAGDAAPQTVRGQAEVLAVAPPPLGELSRLALEDARGIEDPSERADELRRLGIRMGERGLREAGLDTLRQALDAAMAIPPNAPYMLPHPAIMVARAMAEAGHRPEARHAFGEALRAVLAEDEEHQSQNWANLPEIQLEAEGRAFAGEMIETYRRYLMRAGPQPDRAPAIVAVITQAMSGDIAGATRAVQERPDFQGPGRVRERRAAALAIVGQLQAKDQEVAGPALAEAEAAVHAFAETTPNSWAHDLEAILRAEARLGWFDRAIATARAMDLGASVVSRRRDPMLFNQALAFVAIAEGQAKAGDRAGAQASAREAIAIVGKITGDQYKPHPRALACIFLAKNGDADGALRESSGRLPFEEMEVLPIIESERRRAGDEAGVRDALRRELECTRAILRLARERGPGDKPSDPRFDRTVRATADVARILARMGDPDAALGEIEVLPPGDLRDEGLAQLALDRAIMGDESGALSTIGRIASPQARRRARILAAFRGPTAPASRD
ncbi:sigma-70 family RNA polymerase sigma factor [Tundrisphaera sp. TA3]|uniref:sigma-70 family RNA polymerase sigma factor n=1 Tax=Tundrisphaera sp. TA3 TaxID=3435775 RepID=UPI003EBB392F